MRVNKSDEEVVIEVKHKAGGLVIEVMRRGDRDCKKAKSGKKVSVHYVAKVKDKIFDSTISVEPFEFRLGAGEVIEGFDVGVKGMRVGDKRRLKIPPAMGFWDKGAGDHDVPPNEWVTYEVELRDVS